MNVGKPVQIFEIVLIESNFYVYYRLSQKYLKIIEKS